MKSIGTYELKAHLSRVLDEVEAGERVIVTRNGRPVAEIVPHSSRLTTDDVVSRFRALRKRAKSVTLEELLAWRHEDHRF